ncbi:hypothetical protein VTN77DRAFT_3186 [Rasamsonia byssochlamydoides]|uniref:uncharacterized protein n=1 Tax=Rasamsonia byssochlamydoides TaxID=89139 RepID=UPI0037432D9E
MNTHINNLFGKDRFRTHHRGDYEQTGLEHDGDKRNKGLRFTPYILYLASMSASSPSNSTTKLITQGSSPL